jgi:hypothetical protein
MRLAVSSPMMEAVSWGCLTWNKGGEMKRLLCLLLLFAPGVAYADPPPTPAPAVLVVPKSVTTNKRGTATIEVTTSGKNVIVANPFDDVTDVFRLYSDDPAKYVFRFEGDAAGSYKLLFITSVGDKPVLATCVVTIPGPPSPLSPPPAPPAPPTPAAPIAGDGLRMLIVYDSARLDKLTTGQQAAVYGKSTRDYLNAKTPLGSDGKTHEWRIWDKGVSTDAEEKVWQDAMKRPHPTLPYLIVSNGKSGYEGPLPAGVDDAMTILKKFGGD